MDTYVIQQRLESIDGPIMIPIQLPDDYREDDLKACCRYFDFLCGKYPLAYFELWKNPSSVFIRTSAKIRVSV